MDTVSGIARLYTDLVSLNEDVKVKQEVLPIEVARTNASVAASRQALITAEGLVRQQELIVRR